MTNKLLIYFSEAIVRKVEPMNEIMPKLQKLGDLRMGDFNVHSLVTEADPAVVFAVIDGALGPDGTSSFFVADVSHINYRGDGQFAHAMRMFP